MGAALNKVLTAVSYRVANQTIRTNMKTFFVKNIRVIVLVLGFAALCCLTGCDL